MPRTVIGASAVVPFLQCCRTVTSNDAGSVLVSVAKSSSIFFMEAISCWLSPPALTRLWMSRFEACPAELAAIILKVISGYRTVTITPENDLLCTSMGMAAIGRDARRSA